MGGGAMNLEIPWSAVSAATDVICVPDASSDDIEYALSCAAPAIIATYLHKLAHELDRKGQYATPRGLRELATELYPG
jgi:hypothetical protein